MSSFFTSLKCLFKELWEAITSGVDNVVSGVITLDIDKVKNGFDELGSAYEGVGNLALTPITFGADLVEEAGELVEGFGKDLAEAGRKLVDDVADEVEKGARSLGHLAEETADTIGGAAGSAVGSFFSSLTSGSGLLIVGALVLFLLLGKDKSSSSGGRNDRQSSRTVSVSRRNRNSARTR